ncbi:MAG: aspartate kinase, partial [Acidobacteria bacterium]|nr:aspartate kinase [Acidobacteriota bacterium]
MIIFKFGGASIKSTEALKNLATIVSQYQKPLVVVVSAMGKMTNALEEVVYQYFNNNNEGMIKALEKVKDF